MSRDKDAQLTVRNVSNLSKRQRKQLVKWLKEVAYEVEMAEGINYAPVAHWSLMK